MKRWAIKIRRCLRRIHRDESGAVALLCLAAVLVLMMTAWVILDAHKSTRDKVMLQGAADTAAFSKASVEARSMNMISYANIAKRSIYGIHSLYPAMFAAYTGYVATLIARCFPAFPKLPDPVACGKLIGRDGPIWALEFINDHVSYSGDPITPYLEAAEQGIGEIANVMGKLNKVIGKLKDMSILSLVDTLTGGGNSKKAHLKDIEALDNYQHYMTHLTPWWSFSEQLSRGWRSGATTVASFPSPSGEISIGSSAIQDLINKINKTLGFLGVNIDLNVYHGNDNLPIKKTEFTALDWGCHMIFGNCPGSFSLAGLAELFSFDATSGNEAYAVEHILNVGLHAKESSGGADNGAVIASGSTILFGTIGLLYSNSTFGEAAWPYTIDSSTTTNQGNWMEATSNLTFAYINDGDRFEADRQKLSVPGGDYEFTGIIPGLGSLDKILYHSSGYWTMSKSEITFSGEGWKPDMWHPSWTARLRPVHLPGEFQQGDYNMNIAYNNALPYLLLSAQVASIEGSESVDAILDSVRDFAIMELHTSSMGESTVSGVAK